MAVCQLCPDLKLVNHQISGQDLDNLTISPLFRPGIEDAFQLLPDELVK